MSYVIKKGGDMNCPSIEQLVAFARNELLDNTTENIRAHLDAGCEPCGHWLNQLQKLLPVVATRSLIAPPGWLVQQARTLFNRQKPESCGGFLKRIMALLVIDSFAEERLLGFRGTGPMSRHMLYRAGDYDVDLLIDRSEQRQSVDIIGQCIPLSKNLTTVVEADVHLLKGVQMALATKINEFGEFILDGVQEGIYDLKISLKDEEINFQIEIAGLQAIVHSPARQAVN
jgi:hypothetical protein